MIKLSVIVPTIRPHNLRELHASAAKAINGRYEWEMVAIGPCDAAWLSHDPKLEYGWRFIEDQGSPCHCQQRALLHCEGEYVTWAADDGVFLPDSLDLNWDDDAILLKYIEGRPDALDPRWSTMEQSLKRSVFLNARGDVGLNPDMASFDRFWTTGYHRGAQVKMAPPEWVALGLGLIKRSVLLSVGGWDEGYETTGQATVDLGLRLQLAGYKFKIWPQIVQALGYEAKGLDRRPINAAYEADMERYKVVWSSTNMQAWVQPREGAAEPSEPWSRRHKELHP